MIRSRYHRFTLIELIVVLLLVATLVALGAPRLAAFFRGRQLDDEARRLWGLTRYARELAIARAVPVALWIDATAAQYGLEALPGYGYGVPTLTYDLAEGIEVTPDPDDDTTLASGRVRLTWWPDGSLSADGIERWELHQRAQPSDAWYLERESPFSTFRLSREASG